MNSAGPDTFAAMMTAAAATLTAKTPEQKRACHAEAMRLAEQILLELPAPAALIVNAAASGLSVGNNIARVTGIDFEKYVTAIELDVFLNTTRSDDQ